MRMRIRLISCGLVLSLAGGLSVLNTRAKADQVKLDFSGTITEVNDTTNIFGGKVSVGDPFSGTLVYETGAVDSNKDPSIGQYVYRSAVAPGYASPDGLTIHIGGANGVTIQPDYNTAFIINAYDNTSTTLGLADGIAASGPTSLDGSTTIPFSITFLELLNLSQSLYTSDAEPTSLNLSDFNVGDIGVGNSDNVLALRGNINGLTPVPEPASLVLTALGVLGVFGCTRRRRA